VGNVAEWNAPSTGFGATQEVWATISNINASANGVALWMKEGFVGVVYYPNEPTLCIMYDWQSFPLLISRTDIRLRTDRPVVFGGRAYPDGCVQLYVDGELLLYGNLHEGNPVPPASMYTGGGRIGLAGDGSVHFEDFGGGNGQP
jgi:hypothetical protein